MTVAAEILDAIADALDGISGLTVIRGRPRTLADATPPCAWVAAGRMSSVPGPALTQYTVTLSVDIIAPPAVDGSTYQLREEAGLTLASAMHDAILGSSTLLALLTVAPVPSSDLEVFAVDDYNGIAAVVMEVRCEYLRDMGGGL